MLFLPRTLFLDACVFYPAQTRDLFVHLALKDLVRLKWSRRVQEEWLAAILRERPELSPAQKLRLESTPTRMQEALAFQEPLVEGYESYAAQIVLPDPEDAHVVAAAFHAGAEAILTFNLKDFPRTLWNLGSCKPYILTCFYSSFASYSFARLASPISYSRPFEKSETA